MLDVRPGLVTVGSLAVEASISERCSIRGLGGSERSQ